MTQEEWFAEEIKDALDLGDGHWLSFTQWAPDRTIESNATLYAGIPDVEKWGATVPHRKPDGSPCMGAVTFAGEVQAKVSPGAPKWTVESWDPLTLSPSLLCRAAECGDHGFIRGGKWVRA